MGEMTDELEEGLQDKVELGPGEGEAGELEEKPPEKEPEGGEEGEPGGEETLPTRKFKGWDEAERAYGEAHADVTRTRQELSDMRRRLYEMEQANKPKGPSLDEKVDGITDQALLEIRNLPADDADRETKAARIWAKAQREIARTDAQSGQEETSRRNQATHFVNRKLDKVKMSDSGKRLFWKFAPDAPPYLSFDEQVNWAVNEVNSLLKSGRETKADMDEKDRKERGDLLVLGRGSKGPARGKEDDDKPTTLGQDLRDMTKSRVVRSGRAADKGRR